MDTLDLSYFFQTKSQANDFLARLSTIADQTYTTNFNLEKALMEQFGIEKKDKFVALLRDNQITSESASELKAFLTTLQNKITSLPVLSITLAFEPKAQTLKALSDWFVLNMHQQMLFEITVDPQLIAGATFTFNGKHMDFSIKPKFEKIVTSTVQQASPPGSDIKPLKEELPQSEDHQAGEHLHMGR